jgi:hypothetical protein
MPYCKCTHRGDEHEWRVQRFRGYCLRRRECGCTKYRPDVETPMPANSFVGRVIRRRTGYQRPGRRTAEGEDAASP